MSDLASRIAKLSPEKQALFAQRIRGEAVAPAGAQRIPRRAGPGPAPLSFAQERLWFLDRLAPASAAYNLVDLLRLAGRLDRRALAAALGEVVRRHESLRTVFVEIEGRPMQIVAPAAFRLTEVDLAGVPEARREEEVARLARAEAATPFDLAAGPLLRFLLLRLTEQEHAAVLTVHHIASDAWSFEVFVREFSLLYRTFVTGAGSPLPALEIQYADFAVWQRQRLDGPRLDDLLRFWRQSLAGAPELLELPTDRPRPPRQGLRGAAAAGLLPQPVAERLRHLARERQATLFVLLLTAFETVLHRWTGQSDFLLGTPVANRDRVELEPLIGFLVNTLVLRAGLEGEPTFLEALERARIRVLDATAQQELPFERLVEELRPQRSLAYHPLVQAMLAVENPPAGAVDLPGLTVSAVALPVTHARFDFTLFVRDSGRDLVILAEYDRDLFDATTAVRLVRHFEHLLAAVAAEPGRRLPALPFASPSERHQVLHEWNDTAAPPFGKELVHERVARQAALRPESPALAGADGAVVTYGELAARARRLARRLRRAGVGPEEVVALLLPRAPEVVVAMLAVLETGGAFLPLDPSSPPERLASIAAEARCRCLLAAGESPEVPGVARLRLAEEERLARAEEEPGLLSAPVAPDNLAYVIFTSGSTGRPKGVGIAHGSLLNLIGWHLSEYPVAPGDRVSQVAGLAFDASVWEIWPPLTAGGCLCFAGEELRTDPAALAAWITARGIAWAFAPTPLAEGLLQEEWPPEGPLRALLTGGDALHRRPAGGLSWQLVNHYGPTENAVVSTRTVVEPDQGAQGSPPIGLPIANVRAVVTDASGQLVPPGIAGELQLGGTSLARGYLGRPDLTAQRFVPDPWGGAGERLYRTGDLVRRTARGDLQFLGRIDRQVKVRGFRIELGEIEAALAGLPEVREAAVEALPGPQGRRLVAYVVLDGDLATAPGDLRGALARQLPEAMIPSGWVVLPALPLTPNGKVDRAALAVLAPQGGDAAAPQPPRTPIEEVLAGIWADLLGRERVGVFESFFEAGGHSLLATQLAARVRGSLGVELPLRAVFEEPTLAGLAARIGHLRRGEAGELAPALCPRPRDDRSPLSFAQERLWFLQRLDPQSSAYHIPLALDLVGGLDEGALERALAAVVRRHETLRTTFSAEEGEPRQQVSPPRAQPLPRVDLSALPVPSPTAVARQLAASQAMRPFDLEAEPPIRACLLRRGVDEWTFLVTLHHIVSDAWSMEVLVRELAALYAAEVAGRPSPLPDLPIQYADYAMWQRDWLAGDVLALQLDHWRQALAGAPLVLELPTDRLRPAVQRFRAGSWSRLLPAALAAGLQGLGRSLAATPFMVVLALVQALLARWTGQEDLLLGSPVANRERAETAGLIGFFANTVVLRGDLSGDPPFADLAASARRTVLDAVTHQDLPFEKLVEALQPERDLATSPLFQVLLVWQGVAAEPPALPGLRLAPWDETAGTGAKFDLSLAWSELPGGGAATAWEYDSDLFDRATVARLAAQLETLAAAVLAGPRVRLSELSLLAPAERQQLLAEWADGGAAIAPSAAALHTLFEAQAARVPTALALVVGAERLTYAELDRRSGALARRLRRAGVRSESLVGVLAERSAELVVALLAVLKAGGAYVPIDPAMPGERQAFVLADAGASTLLVSDRYAPAAAEIAGGATVVALGEPAGPEEGDDAGGAWTGTGRGRLAYVIYTSGSTGTPKGVAIEHRSAVALVDWARQVYSAEELAGVLFATSIGFDLSVFELFVPLAAGGCAILAENALDLPALPGVAEVRLVNTVPSAMAELVRAGSLPPGVRTVNLAGEPLTAALAERIHALGTVERLFNLYGPSEDTTYSTYAHVAAGAGREPAIGRPLPGSRAFLLDRHRRPVPQGAPGELHLAGAGLARGYLNRPDLTAERFLPDPFGGAGERLYRTGDLARWRPDGTLEFLGRIDHQVKVRGFRIELGEIEAALLHCAGVRGAAVLARGEGGDRRLVAFVAADGDEREVAGRLRAAVAGRLPAYMVPASIAVLDALPLTPNGKVDRKALARIEVALSAGGGGGNRRRTAAGELVAGVWAQVLGRGEVGAGASFFDLGGHSLLASQAVARLRRAFGREVALRDLFEARDADDLAARITAGAVPSAPPLMPAERPERVPLSFAQERLWFLQQLDPGSSAYHIPLALDLRGTLRHADLAGALGEVIRRHEALRTTFVPEAGGGAWQRISDPEEWRLPLVDLAALPEPRRALETRRLAAAEAVRPFDLAAGLPTRALLVARGALDRTLLLTMHHIVSDGWSMEVLVRELAVLYAAAASGLPSPLPDLPIQYADYALWQRAWLAGGELERLLGHWRQAVAGAPFVLALPTDRPRPAVQRLRAAAWSSRLPDAAAAALHELGRSLAATPFMIALSLLQLLLARWSGQDDLLVGSPVANRDRAETEGLIGFFANTLVLRGDLTGDPTFAELVGRARRTVLEAVSHQDLPFERLVEDLQPERDLATSPLFQTLLAWQGAPADPPALPGLLLAPWDEAAATGAKYDLTLSWNELAGGGAALSWEYDPDLFDPTTVGRLAGRLEILLAGACRSPETPVSALPLLSPAERQQAVREWSDGGVSAPPAGLLHTPFEAHAERFPGALALVAGEERLTYGELDRRAGFLARRLRRAGVGPEKRVAVLAERSAALVAGILAVLKAGGAYVPIDPAYPRERQALLLADAGATALLVSRRYAAIAAELAGAATVLDLDSAAAPGGDGGRPEPAQAAAGNLAYLIYTSGSTGRPKGVAIEHRSASALVAWAREVYSPAELAGVLFATSVSFDLSVFELFVPLSAGGCVILAENALELPLLAAAGEVRLVNTVPSAIAELVRAGSLPAGVRTVNLAGEPLTRALTDQIHALGTVERLFNLYGPSEDTTYSTFARIHAGDAREPAIGRPLPGTRALVLDRHLRPVPAGAPGELYLAGEGLARCYLDRPAITAERFLPDPSGGRGERLYRTGDLARWRSDGTLDFLGRIDHQVKVRGFRIELGEIEDALLRCAGVLQAVVIAAGEGADRRLVACVAGTDRAMIGEAAEPLRTAVAARLPSYMVPVAYVVLDSLPLTPNGKVDRKALARLAAGAHARDGGAPRPLRTAWEELAAGIWAEVLHQPVGNLGGADHFFDRGGHSLLATRVASRASQVLGVEVPLRLLFERPTLERFAAGLEEAVQGGARPPLSALRRTVREGPAALSFAQERLWFIDRLRPGGAFYNIPLALRLSGALRPELLAASLQAVVERHEVLRTTFAEIEGRPVQVVGPVPAAAVPVVDLGAVSGDRSAGWEAEVGRLAMEEAARPFDLARGPVLRATLLRRAADEHLLLFTVHHIAADGWSMDLLVEEIGTMYAALAGGGHPALPPLPVQYADFAAWQREWLTSAVLERQSAWWLQSLKDVPPVLDLPFDRPRGAFQSFRGGLVPASLPGELDGLLRPLCRAAGATPFMALLGLFQALLARWAGQEAVVVGSPVAGRNRLEIERLIGFFVNTLPLAGRIVGDLTFRGLLGQVRETTLGAYAHQDLPFERLVEEVQPERSLAHSPVFQVMFVLQNLPPAALDLPGLRLAPVEVAGQSAKFDLTLFLAEGEHGFAGSVEYAADLWDAPTVRRLAGHLAALAEAAAAVPDAPLWELPLLPEHERAQLLVEWNDSAAAAPQRDLAELLYEQAAARPEAPAVVAGTTVLSFGELAARSSRLAARLRRLGVAPGVLTGLCLERSTDLVVALLAVVEAGGAYVPLDPAYPPERLALLAEDAGPRVLLSTSDLLARLPGGAWATLCLDDPEPAVPVPAPAASPPEAGDLLYVIYTSGSTGRPKGARVCRGAFLNLLRWYVDTFGICAGDRFLLLSSFSFDLTQKNLFAPLLAGASLHLPPSGPYDPVLLAGEVGRQGITRLNCTPSAFYPLVEREDCVDLASLRSVFLGGEPIQEARLGRWRAASPAVEVVNTYGPTECTDVVAFHRLSAASDARPVPLGRPVRNARLHVLDRRLQPVPLGAVGQIAVGGSCVGTGYLRDARLTAERFVPDAASGVAGARLYLSGDLGRFQPTGVLDYLGRTDFQVKVRGFRIELGEVETALAEHAGVAEAAVVARQEAAGTRLAAYVVAADEPGRLPAGLREHLVRRLPEHMIPSLFLPLDALPLTPNGKVDRKALARLEVGSAVRSVQPPRTAWEELTAELWAEVLGVPAAVLGVADHFFELGGHSLLATRVVSRVGAVLGVELPLRLLFERPTLERFAAALDEAVRAGDRTALPPLTRTSRERPLALSFAQERLWLLDQLEPGSPAYNLPVALRIEGELGVRALAASLAAIVGRHEVLRTVFPAGDGQPRQEVRPPAPAALPLVDLSALARERREPQAESLLRADVTRPFDLAAGPLLRGLLVRLDDTRHLALFNMHHIASDAWSLGLFARELAALYPALTAGEPSPLPDLPVQYADFAAWQRSWLAGDELERQLAYWRGQLAGAAPRLDLPVDHPRERSAAGLAGMFSLPVTAASAQGLLAAARREGATLFMVLLAAFQAVLSRSAGQADVSVGTPVAGRNRLETEALIGFFVNTLVLRTVVSGSEPLDALVRRVRGTVLGALAHQDLPFERLVEALQPERSLDSTPLFQVLFNLQNTPAAAVALPGLQLVPVPLAPARAKFDLTLVGTAHGEGLELALVYDRGLFDPVTIERFAGRLERVLEVLGGSPSCRVADLPLLAAAERRQLLIDWGRGPAAPVPELAVHRLIEAQVDLTPAAPALVFEDEVLTYAELDRRANRLAHRLRRLGVGPEDRVGICLERSGEAIVALLAALKAGAAYVPLDPAYPAPRLAALIDEAGARAVVTREPLLPLLPPAVAAQPVEAGLDDESDARPDLAVDPRQLAYLLFTSGSTGRPKGVAVEHRQVVHYVRAVRERLDLPEPASFALVSTLSADLGNTSLFPALASGGTLHVLSAARATDPEAMADYFERHPVDCLKIVPSHLRALRAGSRPDGVLPRRRLVLGGEALSWAEADLLAAAASCKLLNHYGPTETTVGVTTCEVATAERRGATVPLGRPLRNVQAYLLDPDGSPAPAGTPGDLHLGGAGVARGYWGRPDLTAERFVPDPFGGGPGGRLYRTGDRVRFLPEGQLQFLGRLDHQVKVRGYRVELGEIEAALAGLAGVREAVVAVLGEGETRRLAAYVVPTAGDLDVGRLREALRERLPDFLVPGEWMVLPRLPLNANGKVDRRALPAPQRTPGQDVPPRDEEEMALARLWEELLGAGPVGVHDSFFELGGQSLLAVRLLARIERGLGVRLSLADLLQAPTVAGLARRLRDREPDRRRSLLVPLQPHGSAPPLFWIHPVGGSVFCYLEIARRLGGGQPSYGLRSPGRELPDIELPDLAALYLAEIRAVQPAGPYRLAGWSMGGVLAYEMARQLEAAGEEIQLLALLDVGLPGPAELEDSATELLLFTRDLGGLLVSSAGIDPAGLERLVATEPSLDRLWGHPELRAALPADLDLERLRDLFTVFRRNLRTVRRYRPERYGGEVILVQSAESAASGEPIVAGWRGLTGGELRVEVVPGDHFSLLRPPAIETLVGLISDAFEGREKPSAASAH